MLGALDSGGAGDSEVPLGLEKKGGACLVYNEKTFRLEVRDDAGTLLEEISPGSVSRTVASPSASRASAV